MLPILPLETSVANQSSGASLISVVNLDLKQLAESFPRTKS